MILNVITTVGTSLISNYKNEDVRNLGGYVPINDNEMRAIEKLKPHNLEGNRVVEKVKEKLNKCWIKGYGKNEQGEWTRQENIYNKDCCAEIKTLLELYKIKSKNAKNGLKLEVYLITTDTAISKLAADLIEENIGYFEKNISVKDIKVIEGLQTDDFKEFEGNGINNLFKEINMLFSLREDKENNKKDRETKFNKNNTILNISGGYKALIPYMTIFAQLYGMESVYIYEDSDSLISIPALPVQIDWAFAEEFYPYLSDPSHYKQNKKELSELLNKGLLKKGDNEYSRTSVGNFFRNAIEKELYIAKSVMGFFFEYKIYEYYSENIYREKYKVVEHSKVIWLDTDPYKDVEIDLLLTSEESEGKDYVAIEVKSLPMLTNRFKKLRNQINKQKKAMESHYGLPSEYHLCFYTSNEFVWENDLFEQKELLEKLREVFRETEIKLKVFLIKANYNQMRDERGRPNSNPYQQLMKDKLKYGLNFKEIII